MSVKAGVRRAQRLRLYPLRREGPRTKHAHQTDQARQAEDVFKLEFKSEPLLRGLTSRFVSVHFLADQMTRQIAVQTQPASEALAALDTLP
jgi:hypothetical protein